MFQKIEANVYKRTEKTIFWWWDYTKILFLCVCSSLLKMCIIKGKIKMEKERTLLPQDLFPSLNCEPLEGTHRVWVVPHSAPSGTVPGTIRVPSRCMKLKCTSASFITSFRSFIIISNRLESLWWTVQPPTHPFTLTPLSKSDCLKLFILTLLGLSPKL